MTIFTPQYIFTGGANPPVASEYRENVYDPDAPPALYDRTHTFPSMDMLNGWLDKTVMGETLNVAKLKDESSTQVFNVAQNLDLDYKNINTVNPLSVRIPGLCATFHLKWPAKVLVFYNMVISNAGYYNQADPTEYKMVLVNLSIGGVTGVVKRLGRIRPSYDINPANVPGLYGYIGKESLAGTACVNLGAGVQSIEVSTFTQSRLVRIACRQLTLVAFRRVS